MRRNAKTIVIDEDDEPPFTLGPDDPGDLRSKGGRPRERVSPAVLHMLGEPPKHPLLRMGWYSELLARITVLRMTGEISASLADAIRSDAKAAAVAFPYDAAHAVTMMLRDDERDRQGDEGISPEAADDDEQLHAS